MENVLERHVHVTVVGVVNFVHHNCVMLVVMNMVNAKMAPVYVLLDGMGSIVHWKDAQQVVRIMDNVVLVVKVYGNVDATMHGMVLTVQLHWNKIVLITKTMIKVCRYVCLCRVSMYFCSIES